MKRILLVATAVGCILGVHSACVQREDPARTQLKARLKQSASLSTEEIGRTLDEVSKSLTGKTVRIKEGNSVAELDQPRRDAVLGILTDRAGIFDEGIRTVDGGALRVLNAPGRPSNPELSAARRLLIDPETLLPTRFEFASDVADESYALDLVVQP